MRTVFLVLILAAACGGKKQAPQSPATTPVETQATEPAPTGTTEETEKDADGAQGDPCDGGEAK